MKKVKHNRKYVERRTYADAIMDSPIGVTVIGVLSILMGIFFIVMQNSNTPVSREEAVAYNGTFESYELSRNYSGIYLQDGTYLNIYTHTQSQEFIDTMESLPKGTELYILVNPNNNYVAEIRTDTKELLNFEASQKEITDYDNGYVFIGILPCTGGAFLCLYEIARSLYKHSEKKQKNVEKSKGAIRYADRTEKSRILLEARTQGYDICYRRVKHVNELVVNGKVYDEKKGIIEFEHKLCAKINDHLIEAGYDEAGYSYINFDGEEIKRKRRLV